MIAQILFVILTIISIYIFTKNVKKIRRNIFLGKENPPDDTTASARWKNMFLVALGQKKMFKRPLPAVLHLFVYVGFILINLEVMEILIDGIFGTHRIFAAPLGRLYDFMMAFFEGLALLVAVGCAIFLIRRYILKVKRFTGVEMRAFPVKDAAIILISEIVLMKLFFLLNTCDFILQHRGVEHFFHAGNFPISRFFLVPLYDNFSTENLIMLERFAWWGHIVGIFAFLNYVPFSKHFHIFMAFPNTYYANLKAKAELQNMPSVTTEVKLMLDPSAAVPEDYQPPTSFGVKDVFDLTRKNLMDAYSCTECGRCTAVCPANTTGKLLSPRKIMMDTRDRLEEVGKNIDANKSFSDDEKNLHSYISAEELWACTTCQACVEACPVQINPMEIIVEMRRYKVMEKSEAPQELNMMFTNVENNGAPWQMAQSARYDWTKES